MAIIILATIFGLGFVSVYIFGDDNPIEEVSTVIIDDTTGAHVDEDKFAADLKNDL